MCLIDVLGSTLYNKRIIFGHILGNFCITLDAYTDDSRVLKLRTYPFNPPPYTNCPKTKL